MASGCISSELANDSQNPNREHEQTPRNVVPLDCLLSAARALFHI
jgi:hypothetical protein